MDDAAWHSPTPGLPSGARFAVISGDPTRLEPFVIRVELPSGYTVPPYLRDREENLLVLAGSLELGEGSEFDEAGLRTLAPGSFVRLRASEAHFATTRQGATVQIFGMGPFDIAYVGANANDIDGRY